MIQKLIYKLVSLGINRKSELYQLFFRNEFNAIVGKGFGVFWNLFSIVLLTFLAIGIARGSYDYLKEKSNNIYSKWVQVAVGKDIKPKVKKVMAHFDTLENSTQFALDKVDAFKRENFNFYNKKFDDYLQPWGRSIDPHGELLHTILFKSDSLVLFRDESIHQEKDSLIFENGYGGIIITQKLLNELGYNLGSATKRIQLPIRLELYDQIEFLEVIAVVKSLPSVHDDYLCFPNLLWSFENSGDSYNLEDTNPSKKLYFVSQNGNIKEDRLQDILASQGIATKRIRLREKQLIEETKLFLYEFTLDQLYAHRKLDSLSNYLKETLKDDFLDHYKPLNFDLDLKRSVKDPYYLAFHFDKLSKIRAFEQYIGDKFEIELDMSLVEEKENFWFVSALTFLISLILCLFSALGMTLFVNNALKTHLINIKSNLGTFKAFGLQNQFLKKAYLNIIFRMLAVCLLLSLPILFLLGKVGVGKWFLSTTSWLFLWQDIKLETNEQYFNLLSSSWTFLAVLLIAIAIIISIRRTINQILSNTPGDLIYDRIKI